MGIPLFLIGGVTAEARHPSPVYQERSGRRRHLQLQWYSSNQLGAECPDKCCFPNKPKRTNGPSASFKKPIIDIYYNDYTVSGQDLVCLTG